MNARVSKRQQVIIRKKSFMHIPHISFNAALLLIILRLRSRNGVESRRCLLAPGNALEFSGIQLGTRIFLDVFQGHQLICQCTQPFLLDHCSELEAAVAMLDGVFRCTGVFLGDLDNLFACRIL